LIISSTFATKKSPQPFSDGPESYSMIVRNCRKRHAFSAGWVWAH